MSTHAHSLRPWAVPVGALALVGAAVVVPRAGSTADAAAALPDKSAAQLLADVSRAEVDGLSGTVVQTSRLGLPELPEDVRGGGMALTDLLSGSTTARVWYAGDDRQRLDVRVGDFAAYDVVRDGSDVWTYDSSAREVTHLVLPEHGDGAAAAGEAGPPAGVTPESAAAQVLAMVDETTEASVGRAESVAGRPAYELVLTPRDTPDAATLVESVRIAVDGETSVPLRVRVYGEGQAEPAVEVGFTGVRFEVPDEEVFAFVPPPGATVEEKDLTGARSHDDADRFGGADPAERPDAGSRTAPGGERPAVSGSGWTTVVTVPSTGAGGDAEGLVAQLSQPVEGGRAVTSALLSVLLLDDGRVLAGAVPVSALLETAAGR